MDPRGRVGPATSVTLALIVWNEEAGLRQMLPRIPWPLFDDRMAVDGGSRDGTVAALREAGVPVFAQTRPGLGAAMLEARERTRTDALVFFHPDGNENPDDLAKLAGLLREGHPFVVASRMLPGGSNEEDGRALPLRKAANVGLAMLANAFFARSGNRTTDVTNGLRGVACSAFDRMGLTARDLTMDYQMVIRALKLGIPITEFPTREGQRLSGRTHFDSLPTGAAEFRLLVREVLMGPPPGESA